MTACMIGATIKSMHERKLEAEEEEKYDEERKKGGGGGKGLKLGAEVG